jgi:hypothetical protein
MPSYFNDNAKNRIRAVVKKVEANRSNLTGRSSRASKYEDWFWAVVRNDVTYVPTSGWYTVIASSVDAVEDTEPTFTERISGDPLYLEVRALNIAEAISATGGVKDGEPCRVYVTRDLNDELYYYFESSSTDLFRVDLTQSGGVAGDKTTKCSYTYDLYDVVTAAKLNVSVLSPEVDTRQSIGRYVAATHGQAYYDSDGVLTLYLAYEVPGAGEC